MVMRDYKLTPVEKETIISFNSSTEPANIFSADPAWVQKIKKLPGARKCGDGMEVDIPKSWIKIIPKQEVGKKKLTKNVKTKEK